MGEGADAPDANRLLASRAIEAWVERASSYDKRWSDHAPVTAVFDV